MKRSAAEGSGPQRRHVWVAPAVIAAITVAAFVPALTAGFVSWDDDKNFIANANFRGLGPDQLRWMWTTFHLGTWIPLSWMTLGLDYLVWGMDPAGYHLTNVLLHAVNAVVAYFLTLQVLGTAPVPGKARVTEVRDIVAAAFAALVFAVHPLRVESVAWITERRDVLSGLFYLASALSYVRGAQDDSRRAYWASVALFALALMAKGTAVTLPVALLLLNVWPLRRLGGAAGWASAGALRAYAGLVPFAILAAAIVAVVFTALQPVEQLPVMGRVAVSAYSLQFYAWKTLIPVGLSPLYALPERVDPAQAVYLLSYAAVLIGAAAAWMLRRRAPGVSVALVAFAAILFPLLGVHQGGPQIAADRITYNASLPIAVLAGGALLAAWRRAPPAALVGGAAIVLVLATLTWRQSGVWRDSESLWARVLEVEPESPVGHNNYGNVLIRQGRVDQAMSHFAAAVRAKPDYAEAHTNLGVSLAASGRNRDAIAEYRLALALRPGDDEALSNLGIALAATGDSTGAIEAFRAAIVVNPSNASVHVNWGNALVRQGRFDDAIVHYRDALEWFPDHPEVLFNWGVALARQEKFAEAAEKFETVLAIQPAHAAARDYLMRARALLAADSVAAAARRKSP